METPEGGTETLGPCAPTAASTSRGGDKMAARRGPLSAFPAPGLSPASSLGFDLSAGGISAGRPISVLKAPRGMMGASQGGDDHKMAAARGPPQRFSRLLRVAPPPRGGSANQHVRSPPIGHSAPAAAGNDGGSML